MLLTTWSGKKGAPYEKFTYINVIGYDDNDELAVVDIEIVWGFNLGDRFRYWETLDAYHAGKQI